LFSGSSEGRGADDRGDLGARRVTRSYAKAALTLPEQIGHLRAKGMRVDDEAAAAFWLRHVSYYRLNEYAVPGNCGNSR
jgi:hypothetical protein